MAKLEFDDEGSRLVEEFNAFVGTMARRALGIMAWSWSTPTPTSNSSWGCSFRPAR